MSKVIKKYDGKQARALLKKHYSNIEEAATEFGVSKSTLYDFFIHEVSEEMVEYILWQFQTELSLDIKIRE